MSAWKRVALERLPEYRSAIEAAENPMALWIELHMKLQEVYRATSPDDSLIRRFYEYARWCLQSPGRIGYLSDAGTAAAYAFYEHLPKDARIRRDLPRWMTRGEFTGLREAFRHLLSEQEFAEFEAEFLGSTKKGVWR